jgi:hypothetical protein
MLAHNCWQDEESKTRVCSTQLLVAKFAAKLPPTVLIHIVVSNKDNCMLLQLDKQQVQRAFLVLA